MIVALRVTTTMLSCMKDDRYRVERDGNMGKDLSDQSFDFYTTGTVTDLLQRLHACITFEWRESHCQHKHTIYIDIYGDMVVGSTAH